MIEFLIDIAVSFLCWKLFPDMIEFGSFGNLLLTMVIQLIFCFVLTLVIIGSFLAASKIDDGAIYVVTIISIIVALCSTFISLSIADILFTGVEFSFGGKIILSVLLGITAPKEKDKR